METIKINNKIRVTLPAYYLDKDELEVKPIAEWPAAITVSGNELGRIFGISSLAITKMERSGKIARGEDGKFCVEDCVKRLKIEGYKFE